MQVTPLPEPTPSSNPGFLSNFDSIDLNDTPQLDLNFNDGLAAKGPGTGFEFGGWGTNWNTPSKWDVDGLGKGTGDITDKSKDVKDNKDMAVEDSNAWSMGGGKKSKKKSGTSAFGFDGFSKLEEEEEQSKKDGIDAEANEDWASSFPSVGKKDKKSKKKGLVEVVPKDPDSLDISVVEAEPVANEDDAWSSWGGAANKREKKKGKKGDLEASISELPQAPPLSSDAQADSTLVEEWGVFGSKKDKKKLKKGAPTEAFKNDEPSVNIGTDQMPEPEMASAWEFGTKKEKKKNQKGATKEQVKPAEPLNDLISDTKPFGDFDVDFSGKKENKKGTNVILEESFPTEEVDLDVPPTSETDKGWNFGTKNDKKKSKKAIPEEPALNAVSDMIEPDPLANAGWNSFPTKKEKNKNKKSAMDDTKPVEGFADVPEQDPIVEDTFPSWGAVAKTEKKGKKTKIPEVKDDPIAILDTTAAVDASNNVADNNWMDWGGEKKKDKKNKKGTFAEDKNDESFSPLQPDIPDVLEFPETFPSDSWGAAPNKKDKKGKKSKAMENEPAIIEVPDFSDKFEVNPGEDDFGGWGLSAKDKKKMEREKERDEQKQKEKEREEQEQKENEEEEAKEREEIKEKEKEKAKAGKKGKVSGSSANSKTKDLIANSTPDIPPIPSIEEDNSWGMWGNTKANKKKGGNKDKPFEAPPPAPTPPAQGLTPEPTPEPVPDFDNAGMVGWGSFTPTNAKGKKDTKKPVKAGKDKTEFPNAESFIEKGPELDDVNESNWGSFGPVKAKNKKDVKKPLKAGKDKFEDPIVESTLDQVPELDDIDGDDWGSIGLTKGSGKKDTKKSTKVEDSKGAKKTVKEKVDDVLAGFLEADIKDDAEESPVKEETPAKAAKSFWSMGGTTSKSKAAKEKEKEKEKAEAEAEAEEARRVDEATQKAEQEANDLIDFDMGEGAGLTLGFEDTPMKKGKSKVADARLSKVSTKESDKASKASKTSDKGRANEKDKGKGNGNGKKTEESNAAAEAEVLALLETTSAAGAEADGGNSKKADAWSFWGSKKTSGPKLDEPKKEIAKHEPANHIDSLNFLSNEPEPSFMDDEPIAPIIPKSAKTTMSTSKPAGKASSTVAARVKALEKEREKAKALEPIPSPLDEEFEPLAKNDPPKKLSAGAKPKAAAAAAGKGATGKKKGSSPAIEEESQASKDSVPGSFPAEGADDDIYDVIVPSPVTKKTNKKSSKAMKEPFMDQLDIMDLEVEDTMLPPAVPEAPPTPPPEAPAAKPVKKERAKVVRDAGSSWGFWGPTPKKPVKEAKPKDDVGASTPAPKEKLPANGLARAKSTKVPKEKEVEKSSAKSSSSDKDKKTDSRPSKQRISSFGGFFGAPPPTRTKPVRRGSQAASRNISRRQSMDIDVGGLPSPPAEDAPEMSTKAAKVMGATPGKLNRKESTRAKQRASGISQNRISSTSRPNADFDNPVVPDPYHIDDDDMVMINAPEDPIMNEAIPEKKEAPKSTKRKVKNEVSVKLLSKNVFSLQQQKKKKKRSNCARILCLMRLINGCNFRS